jgi:hypothetical protein
LTSTKDQDWLRKICGPLEGLLTVDRHQVLKFREESRWLIPHQELGRRLNDRPGPLTFPHDVADDDEAVGVCIWAVTSRL